MTQGYWICTECNYEKETHISDTILVCPKCGAKYTKEKSIRPHIAHTVTITKSPSGKLNVVRPVIFAVNHHKKQDVHKYLEILDKLINKGIEPTYIG